MFILGKLFIFHPPLNCLKLINHVSDLVNQIILVSSASSLQSSCQRWTRRTPGSSMVSRAGQLMLTPFHSKRRPQKWSGFIIKAKQNSGVVTRDEYVLEVKNMFKSKNRMESLKDMKYMRLKRDPKLLRYRYEVHPTATISLDFVQPSMRGSFFKVWNNFYCVINLLTRKLPSLVCFDNMKLSLHLQSISQPPGRSSRWFHSEQKLFCSQIFLFQ